MKTILVTDDDLVLVRILTNYLQKHRFCTLVAHTVPEAISVVTRNKVDAVILDMNMPGGSGTAVIKRMKAFNRTGPIPIVVLSGSMDSEVRQTLLQMGADRCFLKPPDLEEITACVKELMAGAEAANDHESPVPSQTFVEIPCNAGEDRRQPADPGMRSV
jgi:DNA-binding response OmpR family regulator